MFKNLYKSTAASLFIALGCSVLLKYGLPIGAFLFSFGLLSVCIFEANLFTGKAGYARTKNDYLILFHILIFNFVSGWIFGALIGASDINIYDSALLKINSWNFNNAFIQPFFCGIIMYIAVEMFKRKNLLGIIFGVPLFIFSGFQHSIANIIFCGMAHSISIFPFIHALMNYIGSQFVSNLIKNCKN